MPEDNAVARRLMAAGWQEGHDMTCDLATPGTKCSYHPNPYRPESDSDG